MLLTALPFHDFNNGVFDIIKERVKEKEASLFLTVSVG